ncbi:hypothetical protein DRN74_06650 [Candidatus Micrarchaeota archaeon]|nr:MAG: hypothetical protein DRN74_06650 [Candidatus Micrarchaeota archaeon]
MTVYSNTSTNPIRRYREAKGSSQTKLAILAHIGRSTLALLETGGPRGLSERMAQKLGQVLDTAPRETPRGIP